MNRNAEYTALLAELEQTPPALEYTVQRALARNQTSQRKRRLLGIPLGSLAVCFTAFVLLVNLFPPFAAACGRIPLLRDLAQAVSWSPSLSAAVENEYVQPIGLSRTENGITATVQHVIVDQKQVNIFFTLEGEGYESLSAEMPEFFPVQKCGILGSDFRRAPGTLLRFSLDYVDGDVPDGFTMTFAVTGERAEGEETPAAPDRAYEDELLSPAPEGEAEILAEFTFDLTFDPQFTAKGERIPVDRAFELDGQTFTLTEAEVYPTHVRINVVGDEANTAWLKGLDFYLENEDGERFDAVSSGITASGDTDSPAMVSYRLESSWFSGSDHLTVHITGARWLDKDRQRVYVDLAQGTAPWLPEGVELTSAQLRPDGWLLGAQTYPVTLTPDHKASGENVITVYLDQPILNRLMYTPVTLTKTDITGAEKLPGALIEVYDAEGNIIYREYTDANGEIPDIPVVPGTYTFKETYAPSGYALNTAIKTFTVTADGQVHGDTVIRDEVNRVTLKKIRQNGEALAGAVFGLFNDQGDQVQEATSDADGSVVFQQIPYGRYTIRELSAPYGYHPSAGTWEVTVDGTYQNPIGLLDTVVNEDAPGRIRILKQDELDQHVIAGVCFDIYSVDEAGNAADCVAQMTTNEQGIAESPDLFPADYIVMEHAAPTGYEETLWSEKITVGMDEIVSRTVTNRPIQGVLRIVKTDSETAKGLPGAQFTITRISGLPSHNGEGDGEVVAVITTDENGIAQTPWLTWGEYEVTETVVPDDYLDGGYSVIVRIPEQTGEEAPPKAK